MDEKKMGYYDTRDHFTGTGLEKRALKTGDTVPQIQLVDHLGRLVEVRNMLMRGPLIISFYMGGWCAYSHLELSELQKYHKQFENIGAGIIAITPELPDSTLSTVEEHGLAFPVLSDIDNEAAASFGIVFTIPEELKTFFNVLGYYPDLSKGDNCWQLPLPATYIIRPDGMIFHSFISTDYTAYMEPDEIISQVDRMKYAYEMRA